MKCENVCQRWKNAFEEEYFYAKKCQHLLRMHKNLHSTFVKHQFSTVIKPDQKAAKEFYFKLRSLPSQWNLQKNDCPPKPRIFKHKCKTGEVSEVEQNRV